VRVIRGPGEFDDFKPGEILVAPMTAPGWTPLFARAAAVVTDVGSPAAHASIIAREYGIPAVVGCGDATARLGTGMRVMVDGSTGNVEDADPIAPDVRARW
jgi:rifampicin phosphotransferase